MSNKPITALISVWGGNGPIEMIEKSHFDQMEDKLKGWQESQQYRYIGIDGKPVLARDLEDRAIKAEAELAAEKALADRLGKIVLENFPDGAAAYDYRKARGL